MSYFRSKRKATSERNRLRANHRWALDRAKREAIARIEPVVIGRIIRRIVEIRHEAEVREVVIYDFDSARSARRKLRTLGL